MVMDNIVFKFGLAAIVGLSAWMGSQATSVASSYRYLCTSVPGACDYAPATAPILAADVCWNGARAFLKPATGSCAMRQWPYYVESGEIIDPLTNEVQAYIPLDDGCDMGFCVIKPPDAGPTQPGAMCCNSNGCVGTATGVCSDASDSLLWCLDGEQPQQQNGEWVCYEEAA